jgi:para-nitrobenzyl esterase
VTPASPKVAITTGTLVGESSDGVRSFKGVPYAAPPIGPLRWRPPEPPIAWTGERDATAFGPDPIQPPNARKRSRAPGTSEDALTLNIWAPDAPGPHPVMVWIEGGSFMTGTGASARVDGAAFAKRGVVLVTINYRLNVFGFLAHTLLTRESPNHSSGNYGLLDQLAALRWVRENIGAFGGDAGRVTVFGVSAGSASIALMLTMPSARGLFDQAIMQSAGSFRPLCSLADAESAGSIAGTNLEAMRALDTAAVLALSGSILPRVRGLTVPRILRPIRDGYFVPREESDAYDAGDFAAVPVIVGSTANEGGWAVGDIPINTVEEFRRYLRENFAELADEAIALYPVANDSQVKTQLALVFGDTQFSYGTRSLARAISRRQPATYRYLFNHGPSGHSDDTAYYFESGETDFSATEWRLADTMASYWVQFAKTGDPNRPGLPAWPAFDASADKYLVFQAGIAVEHHWRSRHLDFVERYFRSRAVYT